MRRIIIITIVLVTAMVVGGFTAAEGSVVLYGGGDHNIATGENGDPGLVGLGYTIGGTFNSLTDAGWASALSGSFGPFDAIVVGERYMTGLSSATKSSIASYVGGGGRLVLAWAFSGADLANSVFGYSMVFNTSTWSGSPNNVSSIVSANAAGTSFDGGPATLLGMSATGYLRPGTTPGVTMYDQPVNGVSVLVDTYGSGVFALLGWDFYANDGTAAQRLDWYRVLDSALRYETSPAIPEPTGLLIWSLLGIFIIMASRPHRNRV